MKDEYMIINKTQLLKEIEELEDYNDEPEVTELRVKKQILSQSTPLIPEIEKAFDKATSTYFDPLDCRIRKQDYISNLKLDI